MNRFLQYFNLLGIVALAILCIAQWQINRAVNLRAASFEKTCLEQTAKLAEQDKNLKGCAADLDDFRNRLSHASEAAKEATDKFAAAEQQAHQLALENEQLKSSLTNWSAAVSARDEQLKSANTQMQKLAESRNEAVTKFNELAEKYAALVKTSQEKPSGQ